MADAAAAATTTPAPVAPTPAVPATPDATVAPTTAPSAAPKATKAPHFADKDGLFQTVCRAFVAKKCPRGAACKFVHDPQLCTYFYRSGECKFGAECRKNHFVTVSAGGDTVAVATTDASDAPKSKKEKKPKEKKQPKKSEDDATATKDGAKVKKNADTNGKSAEGGSKKKSGDGDAKKDAESRKKQPQKKTRSAKKNTEVFDPMTKPVDLRVTYDLGTKDDKFSTSLTSRDVLLAPNLFSDFKKGELYAKLVAEIESCGVPPERLLKMWHGNDKIDGTHLIADDKTRWKNSCPTFDLVIDRVKQFFRLSVKATRFNWYKDTSQWKPFHFDAAAVKPEIAAVQNFTVGISFGATRDAAFEHADTKTVVSIPQPDGCVYAFARDTNVIWRHGILQDSPVRDEGRISVIAWGWIDGMVESEETVAAPVNANTP